MRRTLITKHSWYFTWHLAQLQVQRTDFLHAVDLLDKYGLTNSPTESGEFLGNLVEAYLSVNQCQLSKVDLSRLVGDFIIYKAREQIFERTGLDIDIELRDKRALTQIQLSPESLDVLLDWGLEEFGEDERGLAPFPMPARQILANSNFDERLANHFARCHAALLQEHMYNVAEYASPSIY